MAMSRRANKSANSKRKVSRKGSKRVSRKGKKGSRKGTKKRGMVARLMGKMRRGRKSNRKSKNNKVAVLVPAKGGQRGGAIQPLDKTFITSLTDSPAKRALNNAKNIYESDGGLSGSSLSTVGIVNHNGTNKNVYVLNKQQVKDNYGVLGLPNDDDDTVDALFTGATTAAAGSSSA